MKVAEFMSSPLYSVTSDRSVQYACDLMNEHRIGSLVVVDYGFLVGIVTSRDLRASHPNRIVADAMTPDPICIDPELFAWDALEMMERHSIERMPVVRGGKALGIVNREKLQIKLSQISDPLTGLYRAPYIQQIGEHLLKKRRSFQLFFIDLDNFGEINKAYGHPAGDDILVEFAGRLKALANTGDFVCRYAGDEFMMITLSPDEGASKLADSMSELTVIQGIEVSASVGIANPTLIPDFFNMSFRSLVSRASLLSTSLKRRCAPGANS